MIKIDLFINSDGKSMKFYTDGNLNFMMSSQGSPDAVILENAGYEFDGLCDDDGRLHFLMQDSEGGLCYIKYDENVWKKYSIFASKEKKRSISNIRLTEAGGVLCAFYIMKHSDKYMLIKHIFSATNLHMTPLVVDLTDFRKDFCICTGPGGNTHLYYRDVQGQRCAIVFDRHFNEIKVEKPEKREDIYVLCVVNNGERLLSLGSKAGKNYTSLVFKSSDNSDSEKVVTFGIARNSKLAMNAMGDKITLFWEEGSSVMCSESVNGGKDFSKPETIRTKNGFVKMRFKGVKTGIYKSEFTTAESISGENSFPALPEFSKGRISNGRRKSMNNNSMRDMESVEFIHKLSKIEAETEKIGRSLDKACIFLEKLVQFKKDAENPKYSFKPDKILNTKNDIGEKNEENIKLFENLSIDEALMDKKEIGVLQTEESEHEQPI